MTTQQPICVKRQHKLKNRARNTSDTAAEPAEICRQIPCFSPELAKTACFCCVIQHKVASDLLNLQLFHTLIGNGPKEVLQNPRFG